MKCDGTRAETRFRFSAKRKGPFESTGASVQSTTGSRGVRISGSNVGYTMFRGSVNGTGCPLHSPVSPSLPLPCVNVCHHISAGLCLLNRRPIWSLWRSEKYPTLLGMYRDSLHAQPVACHWTGCAVPRSQSTQSFLRLNCDESKTVTSCRIWLLYFLVLLFHIFE